MDEVIDACQAHFDEDGVDNRTLDDLKLVRSAHPALLCFSAYKLCAMIQISAFSLVHQRYDPFCKFFFFFFMNLSVDMLGSVVVDFPVFICFAWRSCGLRAGEKRGGELRDFGGFPTLYSFFIPQISPFSPTLG